MLKKVVGLGKHRIFLALAVALALVALPAAAFAAKNSTPFQAGAWLALIDPGKVKYEPKDNGQLLQITKGEQIIGQVIATDWVAMNGAYISVNHDSVVTYNPYTGDFTNGKSQEKVTLCLVAPCGFPGSQKVFDAKSTASLSGNISPIPCAAEGEFKGQITDAGAIHLYKGYGDFKGQSAKGEWSATLYAVCGYAPGIPYLIPLLSGSGSIDGVRFDKEKDED